jgi:hypothetical protein
VSFNVNPHGVLCALCCRLSLLLNPAAAPPASISASASTPQVQQYDQAFVLQQYESLAEMCIAQQAVQQADVVLEAAEVAGLQPSAAILARLTAALRGQPRRSEVRRREAGTGAAVRAGLQWAAGQHPAREWWCCVGNMAWMWLSTNETRGGG